MFYLTLFSVSYCQISILNIVLIIVGADMRIVAGTAGTPEEPK